MLTSIRGIVAPGWDEACRHTVLHRLGKRKGVNTCEVIVDVQICLHAANSRHMGMYAYGCGSSAVEKQSAEEGSTYTRMWKTDVITSGPEGDQTQCPSHILAGITFVPI